MLLKQSFIRALGTVAAVAVISTMAGVGSASAKTLRIGAQADAGTMDPQAQNIQTTITVLSMIYEAMVTRDKSLLKVPALATGWENLSPTVWQFKLRPDVKFHDGSAFGADDVVFSIARAKEDTSQFSNFVGSITDFKAIDDLTVEITTANPDPLLLDKLAYIFIMDKDWAEKNNVQKPQNLKEQQETYSVLHANGTGPFSLSSREPDSKTVLTRNADYWGEMEGDFDEVVFTPISSDPTRIAALISGELDIVIDVPSQDVARLKNQAGIKIEQTEEFRTLFFGFDQASDSLKYGNAGGKNPFKDRRVRQAVNMAIDANAIVKSVMRGLATATGQIIAPGNLGYDSTLDQRVEYNPEKARALLAEAGYPDGFSVTLDCPNDRYINDEAICKAVTTMLTQAGIDVTLNLMPRAKYFPKLWERDTSMFLMGFNSPYFDGMYALETLLMTRHDEAGQGIYNYALYSNPDLDRDIVKVASTVDSTERDAMMKDLYRRVNEDVAYVPLHHQVVVYSMKDNVSVQMRPDNWLEIRWVTMN